MVKTKKTVETLDLTFKILFLCVGFLQYSSLTFGEKIISVFQWAAIALGGILVLYRVINFKKYISVKSIWILVAFAVSYAVSAVLNFKYGYYANFRYFVFMVFEFGLLFAFDSTVDKESVIRQTKILAAFYISVTAVLSVLSFVFMIIGYNRLSFYDVGPTVIVGFVWGRLFGAYFDPNIAAAMAVISIAFSIYFLLRKKNIAVKILCSLSIVLQVLYIVFSDSRTGRVSLAVCCISLAALYFSSCQKKAIKNNRVLTAAVSVILAAVISIGVPIAMKSVYTAVIENYKMSTSVLTPDDPDKINDICDLQIGRPDDIKTDISNRRFSIWRSAAEITKTSPVFGVSHFNIVKYAEEKVPDTYIINNDHMDFDTMHNVCFDIMVSQGLIGLIIFIAAGICILVRVFKTYRRNKNSSDFLFFCVLFTVAITAVASSMFMTEIIYVISPLTLMFWISIGCLTTLNNKTGKEIENEQ